DPSGPGRHRPHSDRRRARQLARDLYGRHGDLARLGHDHRKRHPYRRPGACGVVVGGPARQTPVLEGARSAREAGTRLDTYFAWTREWMTFPNGTHVVEIEIDRDTGETTLVKYTAVDDYGVLVNPMVASGQVHG